MTPRRRPPCGRPLLRRGLALLLATLALLGGWEVQAQSFYDNLDYQKQHLPPGILNVRDRTIRLLYAQEVAGLWDNLCCLHLRLNGRRGGEYADNVLVEPWSKRIEPALYLLREQINFKYRDPPPTGNVVSLPEVRDVPQMVEFDRGIRQFYISYVYEWGSPYIPQAKSVGSEATQRATERHFIQSIAYAAYEEEETARAKAQDYLASDMAGKRRVVLEMKELFQQLGKGDITSQDPRDPYNRKLVASWSSFWLVVNYSPGRNDNEEIALLINRHIEIPLRESVGFKVRGPPYYKY